MPVGLTDRSDVSGPGSVQDPEYVNVSPLESPAPVSTRRRTDPGDPSGETTAQELAEHNPVTATGPKYTVPPARPVPVIVTTVPLVLGPLVGETAVTVGAVVLAESVEVVEPGA